MVLHQLHSTKKLFLVFCRSHRQTRFKTIPCVKPTLEFVRSSMWFTLVPVRDHLGTMLLQFCLIDFVWLFTISYDLIWFLPISYAFLRFHLVPFDFVWFRRISEIIMPWLYLQHTTHLFRFPTRTADLCDFLWTSNLQFLQVFLIYPKTSYALQCLSTDFSDICEKRALLEWRSEIVACGWRCWAFFDPPPPCVTYTLDSARTSHWLLDFEIWRDSYVSIDSILFREIMTLWLRFWVPSFAKRSTQCVEDAKIAKRWKPQTANRYAHNAFDFATITRIISWCPFRFAMNHCQTIDISDDLFAKIWIFPIYVLLDSINTTSRVSDIFNRIHTCPLVFKM